MEEKHQQPDWLRSFGRRQGRPLRDRQRMLLQRAQAEILLNPKQLQPALSEFLASYKHTALEIGFGGGEFLAHTAAANQDTGFIGCEPFMNGVVKLLDAMDSRKLTNIRILSDDARLVLEALPTASLDQAYILFPDPWPKIRHHKRRIIQGETIRRLARVLKPGAELLLATDHVDYAGWMLSHMLASDQFHWTAESQADWKTPPEGWTTTRYETKTGLQGRSPVFYRFVRV